MTYPNKDDISYNGWKNYATWCVGIWIDSDQSSYSEARNLVKEYANPDEYPNPKASQAEALKALIEEMCDVERAEGLAGDLLQGTIDSLDLYALVDYYEED